jgi:hypothetical protein
VEWIGGEQHLCVTLARWIEADVAKMARGGENKSSCSSHKRKRKAS